MSQPKICAVVVTYNRLELLKLCIESLKKQTRSLDEILIINNSSTDGTAEWLEKQNDLIFITQENTGGAGGFHTGIKTAYEKGFDWIWCMDDDVVCSKDALNELDVKTKKIANAAFLSSNVFSIDGNSINVPCIDLRPNKGGNLEWNAELKYALVQIRESTFVSILINREAIKTVGLPIKELYIWGDDTEYTLRLTNSLKAYIVGSSEVVHHRYSNGNLNLIYETDLNRIKNYYYYYRNKIYIYKKYYGLLKMMRFLINSVVCQDMYNTILLNKMRLVKLKIIVLGVLSGIIFNPPIKKV